MNTGHFISRVSRYCYYENPNRNNQIFHKQKGQLEEVATRWSRRCLWFALDYQEQARSGVTYKYSIYQIEYSRNLLFKTGGQLDQVYQNLIDLTRKNLDIKKLKTIFGRKYRPHRRKKAGPSGEEVRIETPDYNLTIFKIHFGGITLKLYDKGERTLRAEVVVHTSKALRCKRGLEEFAGITEKLQELMDNFMNHLQSAHVALIADGELEALTCPTQKGSRRIAGVDITKSRMQAVLAGIVILSVKPGGFTAADVAEVMQQIYCPGYTRRNASYDLGKLRGKALVEKPPRSRSYRTTQNGVNQSVVVLAWLQKQLPMLLSAVNPKPVECTEKTLQPIEQCFLSIASKITELNQYYGINIAA